MVQPLATEDPPRLGPFELTGRIGEGGQGVVYLGRGPGDERVAVKLLHHGLAADLEARTRFLREVAVARRVARFCTAPVLHADLAGSRPYIVSEYVPGPSLRQLVEREGPRRGAALERLAISTATALSAIHRAGVLHRDFKPANVLMGPEGPVVIDFGIAKALDSPGTTATGMALGTPSYLAPEQLSEGEVTAAADVFAWGVTMVFAATGRPAFGADSIPVVMNRILTTEPELGEMEGHLRHLVAAALSKDPARRPTAAELVDHLMDATLSTPLKHPAPAPGAGRRSRRPRGLLLAGVAGVTALGVATGTAVVLRVGENASSARAAVPAPAAPPASEPVSEPTPDASPIARKPARVRPDREGGAAPVARGTGHPVPEPSPEPTRTAGGKTGEDPGGGSPDPVEPTATAKPTAKPTLKPTIGPTVKPTPPPTVKPTVKPTVGPTATPTVKPPAPKPNPYTAPGVCGPGYRVIASRGLGGATVYLLYNTAAGKNCVVTLSKYVVPGKIRMSATLQVQGGPSAGDSGDFTAYAGPVRLAAARKCVIWGGVYGAADWKSGWGNCG